jgi:ketosteroid isomerase-like protein
MDDARTLEGLLDKAEIADVIHAYCFHFDRAEAEEVLALFTPDATVDYGPDVETMTGVEALRAMVTRGLAEFFAATSHHVSNIVIRFDGPDRAQSVSYLYAWHRYVDGRPDSELWGQYHHDFRREAGRWRIARLRLCAAGAKDFHRERMHPIGRRGQNGRAAPYPSPA